MAKDISFSIRKFLENTLLYPIMSHTKIKKTFAYRIENKTQYHRTMILHHTILHPTVPIVEHSLQLY